MSKLFEEEQEVLDALLAEWYEEIKSFTQSADGIFSEKGKMYDRTSPVWERIRFPHGFVQELRKKTDRVDQLLEGYEEGNEVEWDEVSEELGDIFNYSRMFGSLITMYLSRKEDQTAERIHHPYLHQTDMTTTLPTNVKLAEAARERQPTPAIRDSLREQLKAIVEMVATGRTTERQPRDCLNGQVEQATAGPQGDRPKTIHEMHADAIAYVDHLDKCREEES